MSATYPSSIIDARLQVVVNAIGAAGRIQVGTAGMALVLSTVVLPNPPAVVAGGTLTLLGTPLVDAAAAANGFATAARITNLAGSTVISGLTAGVAGSGADIIINLQNITAGSIVTCLGGTIVGR